MVFTNYSKPIDSHAINSIQGYFMRFLSIVLFLLSQAVLATTGLIVTIDQKYIGNADAVLGHGPKALASQLLPLTEAGYVGQAVEKLIGKLNVAESVSAETLPMIWDDARAEWISEHARSAYDNVYIAKGLELHNDQHMASIWEKARNENDVIDYVAMVHADDQLIKPEWRVPAQGNKLRMVYSEACKGGSGKSEFVDGYGALVSLGHTKDTTGASSSPLFTFTFLAQWFAKQSFTASATMAWKIGEQYLNHPGIFGFAKLVSGSETQQEALAASRMVIAFNSAISPAEITAESNNDVSRVEGSTEVNIE